MGVENGSIAAEGGPATPLTVAADGDRLLLSSWLANAVQVWDPATRTLEASYDAATPINAIRFRGELVVAELGMLPGQPPCEPRVVRVTCAAAAPPAPAARTTLIGAADGLRVPAGLAATEDDLWVGDAATGTVWQVVDDGAALAPPVAVATGLAQPEGLAVTPDEELLVVEAGAGRLSAIDPATGAVRVVAAGLALGAPGTSVFPPTWFFNGVAVGPSGTVYVTGDVANVVYAIDPRWAADAAPLAGVGKIVTEGRRS